ncbi:hypothetical protein ABFW12_24645, partial [Mycolicibacterium porcinum]
MSVPGPGGGFELDGWSFKPAAVPWYRTRPAVVAMVATAFAAAAIVVSGVLLLLTDAPTAPAQACPFYPASLPPHPPSCEVVFSP